METETPQSQPQTVLVNPPEDSISVEAGVPAKTPFYRSFGFWAFVFFGINFIIAIYIWVAPLLSPPIVVKDQPLGTTFHIERVRVPSEGFLVFEAVWEHLPNLLLSRTSILPPDVYKDFDVALINKDVTPPEFLAQVPPNAIVFVSIYKDMNRDGSYNPEDDKEVLKDIFGRKLQTTFFLTSNLWASSNPSPAPTPTP